MAPLAGVIVAQLLVSLGADPSPCVQHKSISECIAFRRQHGCAWDVPTKQCQTELSCEQRQSLESCHSELTTGSQALWDDTRNKCFWDGAGNKCRWSDECFGPRSASQCAAAGCEWGKHCTPADMATKPGPGHCFESCKVPSSGTGAPQPHAQQPTSVQKTYLQAGTTGTTDVVHTSTGPVQGLQHGAVQEYLGIPFAQPPVGDLRWAAPQKMSQWNQVFQATAFGPACTQAYSYYGADDQSCKGYTRGKCFGYTEDCLTLNVWTPSSSGSRAVLLWIHGGCYVSGSASEADYNASALASREDVVVVSIQYRLGVFGFLGASVLRERDPKGSTGNYGLLDAVAAMQWVQENIAAFGGDPERVTIFGESSGAGSVGLLLGIQESWPYFSGAIMESGAGSFWSYITLEGAHTNFEKVVSTAKCSNSSRLLSCLVSSSQTVVAEAVDTVPCKDGCTWAPVVDGVFVRGTPLEMAKAESLRPRTPIMAGFNLNDGAMFVPGYPFSEYTMTSDTLRSYYSDLYGEERVETLEGLFPAAKSKPLWVSKYFHAAQACETDFSYSCSAQWMASLSASHGSPSFVYKFSQKSSQGLVLHGDEIPYIFGTLSSPSGEQQKVSKWMMKYWANFARKGNPNGESHGQAGHDLPFWPVWDSPGSAVSLLNISSTPAVASFAENAWPGCSFLENWDFYSLCLPQGRREAGDVSYIV